jgi:hypothetical protein
VTHEFTQGDEPAGGPQHDYRLPSADTVPVAEGPFDLDPVANGNEWEDD